jgi:hypothetical protein
MRRVIHGGILLLAVAVGPMMVASGADAPAKPEDIVWGNWQHHKMTINYFGITSAYSCDSLEDRVREILLFLGARKDAKVNAAGCPRGQEVPSHTAWIETDFYTLAPVDSASSSGAVRAHWTSREINPRRPYYMDGGDCELMEQMKDLIAKSFAIRDLRYDTECVPHEIVADGFDVKGQALVPAPDQVASR